ncbi:MAG: SLAP domain-containing protein [Clostridia bacterium]|nr:SLAP domain-containing protein [Clostridia bacterium]
MKKTVFLCIAVLLLLTGCFKTSPTYSFAPIQDESLISEENRKKLDEYLEEAPKAEKGVSFYAYEIVKMEDGGLKANGFVRNNTKDNVTDIFGTFSIKSSGETIATADFSLGEQQFGVLNSGDNRPWSLIYKKNQVLIPLESIETYSVDLDVSYEIKQ